MTFTDYFRYLGAPLTNSRWSWGAVRPIDGAVFLRVWQDEMKRQDGRYWAQITWSVVSADDQMSPGYAERLRHVEQIKAGAQSYLINCVAVDTAAVPRAVSSFDRNYLFAGGRTEERADGCWLECVDKLPSRSIIIT